VTIRTLALSLGLSAVLAAQTEKKETSNLPILTVCEILSNPLQYDGKLIRIRDVIRGTDEGSWFVGDQCLDLFVTEGHAWPSLISLAVPGNPLQLHSVDFKYDFASQNRLTSKYGQLKRRVSGDCIAWTYTGVFETRKNWAGAEAKTIDPLRLRGFGHLNAAPGQLLLKSADDVTAIPNCTAKPRTKRTPLPP
jgi:hypothetical protein